MYPITTENEKITVTETYFEMNDGVKLYTRIAVPKGIDKCPVVLMRSPYEEALTEPITSSVEEVTNTVVLAETKHAAKKAEQELQFTVKAEGKRKDITPKLVLFEENRNLEITMEDDNRFHAYARGSVSGVYTELRDAIKDVYGKMGVVTDRDGKIVWERGNRKTRSVLELANGTEPMEGADSLETTLRLLLEQEGVYTDVRAALDNGRSPYQILRQNSLKQPENFTGCNLSSVLYYVSEGNYILAMTDNRRAELIVGYDAQNIYVLDPMTGTVHKEGQKDATAKYEACGNVFFGFLK